MAIEGTKELIVNFTHMGEPQNAQHEPTEALINHDLPCIECAYNLRGLPIPGACPECGTAIQSSLIREPLRKADPNWLRPLHRGLKWVSAGLSIIVLTILGVLLLGVVDAIFREIFEWPERNLILYIAIAAVSTALPLGALGLMYGLWRVAPPQPRTNCIMPGNRSFHRMVNVLAVPILVIWVYIGDQAGQPFVTYIINEVAAHACLAIIVTQVALHARWSGKIKNHTGQRLRPNKKRIQGSIAIVSLGAFVVLADHWLNAVTYLLSFVITIATTSTPLGVEPLDGKLIMIFWLAGMWDVHALKRLVQHERAAAGKMTPMVNTI